MHPIIEMLKAYCHNEHLEISENDENDLIKCAREQALTQYLYLVYQKKEYKSFYVSSVVKQEAFLNLQEELTTLFNDNKIDHFYLKGSVLCEIYPDVSLRTRGDIDVVVRTNDLIKAQNLLLTNNFTRIDAESLHHLEFIKNNLMVELHFQLFDDFSSNAFFKNPFDLVLQKEKCLYELTNENFFIHCLHHFSIHLRMGAGLRYILDFYYMLKFLQLDMKKLHDLINDLKYKRLYNNILNSIYYLTDEKLDDFIDEDVTFFFDYLIRCGIHGFSENNKDSKDKVTNHKLCKRIFYRVFMPNKCFRTTLYPKLGKKWYTYPLCLIHRILHITFTKIKRIFLLLFTSKGNTSKEEKDLYKKIGI